MLEKNKHVTLSIDIMYVNIIPFVTKISSNIKFTTVKAIQNRTKAQLVQSIKNVLPIYTIEESVIYLQASLGVNGQHVLNRLH